MKFEIIVFSPDYGRVDDVLIKDFASLQDALNWTSQVNVEGGQIHSVVPKPIA